MKHNCKIKDSSLNLELKTVEPSKINKLGRTIVNIRQSLRKTFNITDKPRVIRISGHLSGGAKKDLNHNIITEVKRLKDKQVITVRTDINSRFKRPI